MFNHRHTGGETRHARAGFGFAGGRFGGRHRGARLGRVFDHGDLRYVLLRLIADKPSHGYELIKAIEEKFGGMYSPSPGVVYPTLTLLEELGHLRAETGGGSKRLYAITEDGTAFLDANRAHIDVIFEKIAEVGRALGGGPAPEIRRAMHNLDLALSIRLGKGPLDDGQVRAVAEAIDRAAGEVERS